ILVFVDSLIDADFARRRGTSLATRFVLGRLSTILWITPTGFAGLKLSVVHDRLHLSCLCLANRAGIEEALIYFSLIGSSIERRHSAAASSETDRRRPAASVFGARPRFLRL